MDWQAGSELRGNILFNVDSNEFPCFALTIELRGIEESNFEDLGSRAKIIKLKFPIREWTDAEPGP